MFYFYDPVPFIVCIIFAWFLYSAHRRIGKVERMLQQQEAPKHVHTTTDSANLTPSNSSVHTQSDNTSHPFIEWCKEDWLLKIGALLLIIGAGWFVRYAFAENWVGPVGRITFGLLLGTLVMVFGFLRANKYMHQGSVFLTIGSTIVIITIFAARNVYDFFTPLSALGIMFASTVFMAFASVQWRNKSLAIASLILASIAPILTNSGQQDYVGLFVYLFMVTLGSTWITMRIKAHNVTRVALAIIALYSVLCFIDASSIQQQKCF
jgi:uncharacterized membrane protein